MKNTQHTVYAFIDSQNLNLGTSKDIFRHGRMIYTGWRLDFNKFYNFLADKYRVTKTFLFIGYIQKYETLYRVLKSMGYILIFKPTINDHEGKQKGNVDAELVLHTAAIEFTHYDQAVIVSGDGDFRCLHEFLHEKEKLKAIVIPNQYSESSLLKEFGKFKIFLNREKNKLELHDTKNGRRRS